MNERINLIHKYGFNGFAMYYYWFSENTITQKNMLMKDVVDIFFKKNVNLKNKKIFFIWANEEWTNNPAFGAKTKYTIKNEYNDESFEKNANNLMNYFKHNNYLKIDNKPVFFIYHTYLIDNIDTFYKILNKICINNGFDGVHLVLNAMESRNPNYKNFYINFNYKKYQSRFYDANDGQIKLNYQEYISTPNHFQSNTIQTVVFDFNNRPRLYQPNRLSHSTICINNGEFEKLKMCEKIVNTYTNSENELDNILLINSFNEWGENMAFEPTKKYGYYNLNLLIDGCYEIEGRTLLV